MQNVLKVVIISIVVMSFMTSVYGQEEMSKPKSTYERFLSDIGTLITKDFYNLTPLESSYKNLTVKVIKLDSGKGSRYFLHLKAKEKRSNKTAVIAETDLNEISKALNTIIKKSKEESTENLEYRERYFVTDDGFKVGYFQKGSEQTFFIDLDDRQSKDNYYFDDFEPLIEVINKTNAKIESLKK